MSAPASAVPISSEWRLFPDGFTRRRCGECGEILILRPACAVCGCTYDTHSIGRLNRCTEHKACTGWEKATG